MAGPLFSRLFILIKELIYKMVSSKNSPPEEEKSVEERLKPWLDQAEYLIVLTIIIMLWGAGWVDLLSYKSDNNVVFGLYSIPFMAILLIYTFGFGFWIWTMVSLKALARFKAGIRFFQQRPLLFFACWGIFPVLIWTILGGRLFGLNIGALVNSFPMLGTVVFIYIFLFNGLVLWAKIAPHEPVELWRRIAGRAVFAIVAIEVVFQGLAWGGLLSINNTTGVTVPYGRIYQSDQGFANGVTNRYGWYYPEFVLAEESYRVILNGDTFVQALQVPMDAHMGVQLQEKLATDPDRVSVEVMAQGQMGYGSSQFLNTIFSTYIWDPLDPDEIIVFFHLANDFQINHDEAGARPRMYIDETGIAEVFPDDVAVWHDLAHVVILGHDSIDHWRTVISHSLFVNWLAGDSLRDNLSLDMPVPYIPTHIEQATAEAPFGPATFMFTESSERAEQSLDLLAIQLRDYTTFMANQGVHVRVVTIPHFPAAFYENNSGANWTPRLVSMIYFALNMRLKRWLSSMISPCLLWGK